MGGRQVALATRPAAADASVGPTPACAPDPGAGSLPGFPLALEWKAQPRLWGHSLHPMCTYLASFPAGLAHAFIARYTRPGDVVLDPFSGRGTVPLQACAEGRIGVGNDLSPLAWLLTAAKVDPPAPADLFDRLAVLRAAQPEARVELPHERPEVTACFHPATLAQLQYLRRSLDPADRTDRFIAAILAGALHGRGRGFLSPAMPNVFSMPAEWVRRRVEASALEPAARDAFELLERRALRLLRDGPPTVRGIALHGDARDAGTRTARLLRSGSLPPRARLVVSSPPYLRVLRYGSANWLRLWLLGLDPAPLDAALDHAHRPAAYASFLRGVLADLRPAIADDAVVVLVLGDVVRDGGHALRRGVCLAHRVWEEAAQPEGYRLAGVAVDEVAGHRKSTRIWGEEAGRATSVDRILVLAPTELGRRRAVEGARLPIPWEWPLRRAPTARPPSHAPIARPTAG